MLCFLIARSPPRATRTDTLCPYTTRVRSGRGGEAYRDAAIHRRGRRRAPGRARGPEALHLVELPGPRLGAFRPGPADGPRLGDLAARVRAEGLRDRPRSPRLGAQAVGSRPRLGRPGRLMPWSPIRSAGRQIGRAHV